MTVAGLRQSGDERKGAASDSVGGVGLTEYWKIVTLASLLWLICSMIASRNTDRRVPVAATSGIDREVAATDPWFAARATAICRALNLGVESNRMQLSTNHSRMKSGAVIDTISIDCRSKSGTHIASLLFDANTRELITIGCIPFRQKSAMSGQIGRQTALRIAWSWMCATHIAEQSDDWSIGAKTRQSNRHWQVWFVSRDRKAVVQLDGYTGQLCAAWNYRNHPC